MNAVSCVVPDKIHQTLDEDIVSSVSFLHKLFINSVYLFEVFISLELSHVLGSLVV